MPLRKELVITAAAVAAAGALVGGVAAVSSASTPSTVAAGYSGYGPAQGQGYGGPGGGPGGHEHTAVTGDELTKVTAAVKAKDSAITVTSVQKDPDGSYDVHGTKAGAQVMVEVSKDLKTIEVRTGGGRGPGGGGPGGHEHTAVTGDELTKVTNAVKAKDSAITVTSVQKDPDGSYDVHGTKAGAQVMVEVSKDLKTIEVRTGGPGGRGPGTGTQPAPSATTSSSTSTTT